MKARSSWKAGANRVAMTLLAAAAAASPLGAQSPPDPGYLDRTPEQDVIYFVLPDRFENGDPANDRGRIVGGRLDHGFDPAAKGFYHGGDLKGLTERLDYIAGLGATAIWLGPIYKNKPVQGGPGQESAGYHGYWITDFTQVDPHFGTRAELKTFVDAAHARGMKVYLDIITNHTADVIKYRECPKNDCSYRSLGDYPHSRRGGLSGAEINSGFTGIDKPGQRVGNFERLKRPDFAYTPYVPRDEARVKVPAWLNDPIYYHNRGDSTFRGESSQLGDFAGLDDLFTENPRVVDGFIEIFGQWIDDFGIDGFRIDTARHVNPEFWQAFVPAMTERAKARGIPNFHIFGEVFDPDPGMLARFTKVDRYPAVLDFAFQSTATEVIARGAPTERLARLFQMDSLYEGGAATAMRLPTFLGNHDMGRFAHFVRQANPTATEEEILKRVILGHAMLLFARGIPTIYYGDEQGFAGDGGDQDAREDMFPSRVASYNDNRLVGSGATTAQANFDSGAALYRAIAAMAAIRKADPALSGGEQVVRLSGEAAGVFAFSRRAPSGGGETLVVLNTATNAATANIPVDSSSRAWQPLHGRCAPAATAPGSYRVEIAPLDFIVCKAAPN
ncbi:alpha-amylase family glycosyl hydrolase [Allosphingosinicella deserti]|uniref:Alpha-amylase n=1 Tax=Allosphingosinicella deserti TaxID=2116704 RepID=A0A2P7QJE9_9SPHN|nr:alpha-amylase family glycosyl hydrolase [Sphingomonas deserti]PSJ38093.1 alpha-amylase [Sphingomonas deserti]